MREEIIESQLKEIVTKNFKTAEVLEKYNLDYCCNGNRILKDAIKDLPDYKNIIDELNKILNQEVKQVDNYNAWNLLDLIDHIVNVHHVYISNAIPKIKAHLEKINEVHREKYSYLSKIQELFEEVSEELQGHMMKEERVLFPLIKYLVDCEKFNEKPKTGGFGTIKNPIRQMEIEHDSAGNILHMIRELTTDYKLPEDACTTFSLTYNELKEFEKDLHKHIHLENNILFPKSIELEEKLLKK